MSVVVLLSGCTSFGAAPTTDGAPDGGAPDGGAGDVGAPSANSFCAKLLPKPAFCADFDDGVFPPVNGILEVTSAAVTRDDTMGTSLPSSLLATVQALKAASGRIVFASSGAAPSVATLTFMARVRSDFHGGETQLATLQGDNPTAFGIRLGFSDDGLHAVTTVGSGQRTDVLVSKLDRDQWFKVTIVLRRGSADFTIGTGALQQVTFNADPLPAPLIGKIGLYGDGSTTAEANFDDIVLIVAP